MYLCGEKYCVDNGIDIGGDNQIDTVRIKHHETNIQ